MTTQDEYTWAVGAIRDALRLGTELRGLELRRILKLLRTIPNDLVTASEVIVAEFSLEGADEEFVEDTLADVTGPYPQNLTLDAEDWT
jgi:hypothetical protein